jgi:hypothetical protein
MKDVYKTRDGEVFEGRADAKAHEDELFDAWVAIIGMSLGVQGLIDGLDDFDETEFFDTPRAVLMDLLRRYFDTHEECGE